MNISFLCDHPLGGSLQKHLSECKDPKFQMHPPRREAQKNQIPLLNIIKGHVAGSIINM